MRQGSHERPPTASDTRTSESSSRPHRKIHAALTRGGAGGRRMPRAGEVLSDMALARPTLLELRRTSRGASVLSSM